MKILSDEQFQELMADLGGVIGEIREARKDFDGALMRKEIIDELKRSLSQKNSLFKSLEREELELEQNLEALKNVKKEFYNCKDRSEIRLIIASLLSMFVGGIVTILMMWFMGKFG